MGSVKNVVVGITGGIAAYKTIEVVSRLKKLGYEVNVILTKNACEFVTPLTLETISNNPVITDMFNREVPWEVEHISLAHNRITSYNVCYTKLLRLHCRAIQYISAIIQLARFRRWR